MSSSASLRGSTRQREPDDAALVDACLRGETRSWDTLVQRYRRLVYSIPIEYGFRPEDADDVFQNVFAIVLEKLSGLRDRRRLSAWLITTTHRECWRLRRKTGVVLDPDRSPALQESPAPDRAEAWELRQTVRAALSHLSSRCRELLRALFLDPGEPSYAKVSERLGLPVGSIGPTRARCFEKLEVVLRDMAPELFE